MNKTKAVIFFQDYGGLAAMVVAITATLGSLYYSEIAGFVPCTLCWYQRILMYPLTLITLVGVLKQDEFLPYYVLPFSVLGIGVSGYHTLIQSGVFSHPTTCTEGVPCSLRYVSYAGFITIPLMAFTAFVLITAVMIATLWAFRNGLPAAEEDESGAAEPASTGYKWGVALGAVVLLLVALVALTALRSSASQTTAIPKTATTSESLFKQQTFGNAPGCIACHSLEPGTVIVGPSAADMARAAAERKPGLTAAAYLRESILDPNAFVVEGFTPGVMYQQYDEALTASEVDELVSFLLSME